MVIHLFILYQWALYNSSSDLAQLLLDAVKWHIRCYMASRDFGNIVLCIDISMLKDRCGKAYFIRLPIPNQVGGNWPENLGEDIPILLGSQIPQVLRL